MAFGCIYRIGMTIDEYKEEYTRNHFDSITNEWRPSSPSKKSYHFALVVGSSNYNGPEYLELIKWIHAQIKFTREEVLFEHLWAYCLSNDYVVIKWVLGTFKITRADVINSIKVTHELLYHGGYDKIGWIWNEFNLVFKDVTTELYPLKKVVRLCNTNRVIVSAWILLRFGLQNDYNDEQLNEKLRLFTNNDEIIHPWNYELRGF